MKNSLVTKPMKTRFSRPFFIVESEYDHDISSKSGYIPGELSFAAAGEFARSLREFARVRANSREFAANDSSPGI